MHEHIKIRNRKIGHCHSVYIVAEMSANHGKDFDKAVKVIESAKEAGADAIKLQTYTPDTMTINCKNKFFQIEKGTPWERINLYDLYSEAFMPWEWQPKLKSIAEEIGIDLFSTAFDPTAVDFLEEMGVSVHKVASFEIVDIPLIEKMAKTGKPIIISTGMATLEEIEEAVRVARHAGAREIALLKCTSAYPAKPEEMNLKSIPYLIEKFKVPVGLSDHTLGIAIPITAVALGASIIEKHFTLSRSYQGPDSNFSLEPHEFKEMVESIRDVEKALGEVKFGPGEEEAKSKAFRRSIFVTKDIKVGEIFTHDNLRSIRPGYGLHPRHIYEIIGKKANQNIKRGTPLTWDLIEEKS